MIDQPITMETVITAMQIWIVIVVMFFILISAILNYHWNQYGVTQKSLKLLRKTYFGVSGILFMALIINILIIYNTQ